MRIRSVQLVNAPNDERTSTSGNTNCYAPLGLLSIGSHLLTHRAELGLDRVEVIDGECYDSSDDVRSRLDADLVGFSVLFSNYRNSLALARTVKSNNRTVVFGNDHASHLAEHILAKRRDVDYIIRGDTGEESLRRLILALNGQLSLDAVPNLVWRDGADAVRSARPARTRLGDLPIINRSLISDYSPYFDNYNARYGCFHDRLVRPMSTNFAKGCGWGQRPDGRCLYCDIYDLRLDYVAPGRVWRELEYLQSEYRVNWVYEVCDSFTSLGRVKHRGEPYLRALAARRPAGIDVGWFVYARSPDMTLETLTHLRDIGVERLNVGFDSGDDRMLATLSKGAGASRAGSLAAAERATRVGMQLYCSIVLGSVGESAASLANTVQFVAELLDCAAVVALTVSPLLPLPGSKAWRMLTSPDVVRVECSGLATACSAGADLAAKYRGRDALDLQELASDWVGRFCAAGIDEIWSATQSIQDLVRAHGAFTGGFGIPEPYGSARSAAT